MPAITMLNPDMQAPISFDRAIVSARPALQRHALRLTKDHAAADDLVQDTLTRAWGARMRFQSGTNMNAWLFRIARNAFLSGLRRTRRQVPWDPDRHEIFLVHVAMQDEALYARDLRIALSRLPLTQQDVLALITHEGMSMADAADKLGIPLGTAKSHISRARASILAYMGEGNPGSAGPADEKRRGSLDGIAAAVEPAPGHVRTRYKRWKASGATTIG